MIKGVLSGTAVCLLLAGSTFGSSIDVNVKCQSGATCDTRGAVVMLQSPVDKSMIRRVALDASGLVIAEQPGSEWEMTVEAKGLWALPQRVVFPKGEASSSYTLDVWRTGTLQFQLTSGDPLPASANAVNVVIASRPEPRIAPKLPRGTSFECSTEKPGHWKCAVPATMLDVGIRVEGYAPYHQWDVKVPVAGVIDLGVVKVQKGATVVAWLDPDFAGRVEVPVRAVLRYEVAPASSATAVRLAAPVAEGVFTKKGVVQLSPVAPGRYILEARVRGFAPAQIPVQTYEGRVTTPRRSIELLPALSIRLLLQPPLGPGGIPWQVELWRRVDSGTGSRNAGGGTASREGIFEAGDQSEGPLHVYLKDAKQNILASRDIVITSGVADYPLQFVVNAVSGRVTIDELPLPSARLLFGGSGGAEKISVITDADGRFTINLPRRGKWIVDVEAPREGVAATAEVTVDRDEVEIALPATEISGWVRDADGQRVPAARVVLFAGGGALERPSDGEGNFRFRGMRAGPAQLRASDPRTRDYSADVDVTVPADGKVRNVEINLESVKSLKGVVRSKGEIVVGASVHGWAFLGPSGQQKEATTDLQGNFAFDVPRSVPEAVIIVAAPGRTLESFRVPTGQDSISLELAPRGGTLRLWWTSGALPLRFTFNDHFLPAPDVFLWARRQGVKVEDGFAEIPNVAPGKYRFCSVSQCAEGYLAVGGQLVLDASKK